MPTSPNNGMADTTLYWLDCIEKHGVNLTDWEQEFVRKIGPYLRRGGTLTESQRYSLEKIYAERTP